MRKLVPVFLLTGICFFPACGGKDSYQKPMIPVKIQPVEEYFDRQGVRYSANIKPYIQVELAFKVGGYIRELHQIVDPDGRTRDVQEGDWVSQDMVLARVREGDYSERVNQAKSQLEEAEASLKQAQLNFKRVRHLFDNHSITKPEFDDARAKLDVTKARVDGAKAQLEQFESALKDASLVAGMNGMVLKRDIEVGSLVSPGTIGFVLADTTTVKAVFGVPDIMLQSLKIGGLLEVTTEAVQGMKFKGLITRIAPSADPKSRVFDVEIKIPNPKNTLKAGMIVSLEVGQKKQEHALMIVPLTSIVRSKSNPKEFALYVVEEKEGKTFARIRDVRLGEAVSNSIVILEGISFGEKVVVSGATLIDDGVQIRVIPNE
jgi:RND family efflux transporter MFP subunit